jgi:glycine cleavage system H protein
VAEYLETTVDKFIFRVKTGYLYSEAGVWLDYDAGRGVARAGLSDYRQQVSGDAAFVELPAVGSVLASDDELAHVETIKVDLMVPTPCAGEVVAANAALADAPELVNQQPYGDGWLIEIKPAAWPVSGLVDAAAYLAVMRAQAEAEAGK